MKRKVNQNSLKNLSIGRPVKVIDEETLLSLRSRGWSVGRLANKFSCSVSTIKKKLKKLQPKEKDEAIMSFAAKLEVLAKDAPTGFCKKELMRQVNFLRTRYAVSRADKKELIVKTFIPEDMPRDVEEISEDCGFPISDTLDLLSELVAENRVEARLRGGVHNRGRKKKHQYFLIAIEKTLEKIKK